MSTCKDRERKLCGGGAEVSDGMEASGGMEESGMGVR